MQEIKPHIKTSSCSHYILKYVKFKGGIANVAESTSLFTGKVADKSKARRSARVLERYGYLKQVDGDVYQLTPLGLSVIMKLARVSQSLQADLG